MICVMVAWIEASSASKFENPPPLTNKLKGVGWITRSTAHRAEVRAHQENLEHLLLVFKKIQVAIG